MLEELRHGKIKDLGKCEHESVLTILANKNYEWELVWKILNQ